MASKPKSFLQRRETTPSSASDEDFALVVGKINPGAAARPVFSQNIPISRVKPNPYQARQHFEGLDELAEAIRAQGFTSRLRVRPDPTEADYYQLVYGERRLRAATLAGLMEIPCDVAAHTDKELVEIGLAENIQRQDLTPLEEAQAFQRFVTQGDYTIRELADRLGKNKDYVAGRLALLQAPEDVQQLVAQKPDAVTAARRIAQLESSAERKLLIDAILHGTLNKEEVREIVRELKNGPTGKETAAEPVRPDVLTGEEQERFSLKLVKDTARVLSILGRWERTVTALSADERDALLEAAQQIMFTVKHITEGLENWD